MVRPIVYHVMNGGSLLRARLGSSATIDVANDFTRLTLDTIALCTMNYRFNSFYSNEKMHPFVESMVAALTDAEKQSMLPDFIGAFRIKALNSFRKHSESMKTTCKDLIEERRRYPVEDPTPIAENA